MEKYLLEILIAVFGFLLTVIGTVLVGYFKAIGRNVEHMSVSMGEMNIKLEKVITDQTWHKEEMREVKDRISKLED